MRYIISLYEVSMPRPSYTALHKLSRKAALISGIQALLEWDQETYMPQEAIALRSEQIEYIASLYHKERTSKTFAKVLFGLIDKETGAVADDTLTAPQIAALKRWRRDYLQAIKLPQSFVKLFAKTTSTASHAWQVAKEHNDFKAFAPHLEKVVHLSRKKADLLGFRDHPYDALLDLYEPDMKISLLTPLFNRLKLFLTELLKEIATKPACDERFLHQHFPKQQQLDFSHKILHAMGFHPSSSRLDLSSHPFCSGLQPKDTRMTTHVHPENLLFCIGAVLHEAGHGLYNMQLPAEQYGSPLGEQVSLGLDESQSRFWETFIGQGLPFWKHFFPLLQQEFPEQLNRVRLDDFYKALNAVKPSLIRIDSDEVSYNLHVILRFEIEKGLIEGSIKVKEVPLLWNAKMREYLGVCPQFDGQGCLQDIHWSLGYMGYFPTYTLGNLYAAQFFEAFQKQKPAWHETVAKGSLKEVRQWLKENIHTQGRQFSSQELCQRVTGKPFSEEPYINYLTQKYQA